MRNLNALVLFLLLILLAPLPRGAAEAAAADPGAIAGEVAFPGFTTSSISITAVGSGDTVQKTVHDSSTYQLAVNTGADYAVSASCGLSGGNNNALTVSFNQRTVAVAPGQTVANNYVYNTGIIRFQVDITGDPTSSSYAAGSWATKAAATSEKTATFSSGTPATSARTFSWDLPVIANQQIELAANIDVQSPSGVRRYAFGKTAPAPYALAPIDVAPGELVIVPLGIHFLEEVPPPPATLPKGTIAGNVNLLGLPSNNLLRHYVNGKSIYTNPGTHSRDFTISNNQYTTSISSPTTYFDASLDSSLRWPHINGDAQNNQATAYPNTTTYVDFEREGGFLTGTINITGSATNEDLKAITLNFSGLGLIYDPATKTWSPRENNYGSASVKRDSVLSGYTSTSVRDYRLFLTTGDWEMSSATLSKQQSNPAKTSSVTFIDHRTRYNAKDYFGTPIFIAPGTNEENFEYCLGSAIFRFRDAAGRLLGNPFVSGKGSHQTDGTVDLTVSSISATSAESGVPMPEVEIIGPAGDYNFTTIRVAITGGSTVTYPARNLSLACNTTKVLDFPGPVLNVTAPAGEVVTNAQMVPVSGQASGGAAIAGVTVNGQATVLSPVAGSNNNAVSFTHNLSLADGDNLITVTATDTTGAQAADQLRLFVDRWQPTVSIVNLVDGEFIPSTQIEIPLYVEAGDRGYGYTFSIHLDGVQIHAETGAGNSLAPVGLSYSATLNSLALGEHHITATVSDKAGNSASASVTILVDDPPPVLHGLNDQVLEATDAAGAEATFDVTATASCNFDLSPGAFQAPVLTPQANAATSAGNSVGMTFQWSAVTAPDGHAAQYLVQLSDRLDFSTILFSSEWQAGTTWTQALPAGTWFWRVTARDSVHPALQSAPAVGNSFSVLNSGISTARFSILHHTDCTYSGGVYPDAGPDIWVGPFDGVDVDRSFLMFDTASLGSDVTLISATLMLDFQVRDFVQNDSLTEVRESTWALPGAYNGYIGNLLASQPISVGRPLGLIPFGIRPDYIEENGVTKFALKAANEDFYALYNSAPGYKRASSYLEVAFTPKTAIWAAPTLIPQENAIAEAAVAKTFRWNEVTAADGDPVEFLVEVSRAADFSAIDFSSPWQTATAWTQSLPAGTWYWRVKARDAVHPAVTSNPAASSFSITSLAPTAPPGGATVVCSPNSGAIFPLGATTVTCTATDACSRTATGSFTITVEDTMPPELTVPADLTVEASSAAGAPVEFSLLATDTVDPAPTVSCLPASGSLFPIGASVVSCTASDASGNRAAETFQVTVENPNPPALTAPADLTVEATAPLTPVDIGQASVTHLLPYTISNDAPDLYPVAVTVVTWTATDSNGRSSSAVQTITVTDSTPPTLQGLDSQVLEATSEAGAVALFGVTAADLADPAVAATCSAVSGSTFPLGETAVVCTATDASGNSASGSFTIAVRDTTAPELTIPADVVAEGTAALSPLGIGEATASDFFAVTITNDAPTSYGIGITPVTWTATDANGNTVSGTQTVTVSDSTPPAVAAPASLIVEATGALTPVDPGAATATDAIGIVALTSDAPPAFPLGMTAVTWTATDAAGNVGLAVQTVTVTDSTPPSLQGLDSQVLEATSTAGAVALFSVTAADLADPAVAAACSAVSGSTFPLGETAVVCTATDATGNSVSGSFTITVRDTTAPELTVPDSITVPLNTPIGSSAVQAFLGGASAADAVDAAVGVTATPAGDFSTVGARQVTFTAIDDAGNQTTRTSTIQVIYGCGEEFLAPVGLDKPFKLGSTVPVKIEFCDASGAAVTSAVVRLFLYPFSGEVPAEEPIEIQSPGEEDTGNLFRVSDETYIYNLKTKGLFTGTYQIRAALDDGTSRTVQLALK